MERILKLGLILILVLLLILFFPVHGLAQVGVTFDLSNSWKRCPYYGYNVIQSEWYFPVRSELLDPDVGGNCDPDGNVYEKVHRSFMLNATWLGAPYDDEDRDGKTVQIESIKLNVTARGCKLCGSTCGVTKTNDMDVYVWDDDRQYTWKWWKVNYNPIGVGNREHYQFDVTDKMFSNDGVYHVMIANLQSSDGDCLYVFYLELEITYYLMGEAELFLEPLQINETFIAKYAPFNVSSVVSCFGGDCGEVSAYLRYAHYPDAPYLNVPGGSGTPMYAFTNPYTCGQMGHDDVCRPFWEVRGTRAGDYNTDILADSSIGSVEDKSSDAVTLSINPGTLDVSSIIDPNNINLTKTALLTSYVDCETASCGNVKILAEYSKGGSGFGIINSSGNLSTGQDNPGNCGYMNNGDSCTNHWNITGEEPGYYNIRLTAYSDDTDVENDTSYQSFVVYSQIPVGVLSITDFRVYPNITNVSYSVSLSGTVSCSEEYCGDVSVYALYGSNREKITSNGLSTTEPNPKVCVDRAAGFSCSVSWNITGNEAGVYPIEIVADSDQENVENATSWTLYLDVRNPVGDLFFPSPETNPQFGPTTINVSETVNLYAIVDCTSSYCGRAESNVVANPSDLTIQNQTLQTCESYPCDFSWDITGDTSGSYDIMLSVNSNESVESLYTSYSLTVRDPERPSLSVKLGSLQDKYELGKPFTLTGDVACDNGDCGEVKVYAKYKVSGGDPWSYLISTTSLSTSENPKTINLNSGESETVSWTVNSSVLGDYILGISSDANNQNVIDSGTASKGIEIFKGVEIGIDIQSPSVGKILARGDEFLLKARVTEGYYPMLGGLVTASSEGLFSATQLNESTNGIYSKTIKVGNAISKGSYVITVFVKKDSQIWTKTTNVYVNPELDVSLETDKNYYEILDKVTLQGHVLKDGKPVQASIKLKLVCPSRSFKEIILDTDSSGNYLYDYLISMATPAELCRFELNTQDSEGNYNLTSKDVSIFPSENEVYWIEFLSPSPGSKYKKGDSVKIRTEVSYGDEPLEGAGVLCLNPMFEENIGLREVGNGVYDTDYTIAKEAPLDLWILTCVAKSQGYFGRKSVNVYITSLELKLTRLSPSQTNFQPGDVANILLKLTYPDNKPFKNATVYLKIGNQIIYLNETSEPGVYEVDYNFENQGVFTFDVYAEDPFGNTGSFPGEIVLTAGFTPFSLLWFVLPFVIAVMLLAGVVWKRGRKEVIIKEEPAKPKVDRKTELENRIAELERKVKNIQKSKDVVEQEYYERKIDEKTFNRMIQNYEQEIIALNVEIEDLKKELTRL